MTLLRTPLVAPLRRLPWTLTTLGLTLGLALAGCGNAEPGAGFTNGGLPPGQDRDKASVRSDMPDVSASANPGTQRETAGELSAPASAGPDVTRGLDEQSKGQLGSDLGGTGTNAGSGGRNGGRGGLDPVAQDPRQTAPEAATGKPGATPPKVESPAEAGAQGGTKPPGSINTSTPRSPQ